MKERLRQTVKKYVVGLTVGALYAVWVLCTGIGIPCLFRTITGWQCPACGISRMLLSLLRLDFRAAYAYNPFLFVTAPLLLGCLIGSDVHYIKTGNSSLGKWIFLLWGEIVFALIFGVWRNIG